MNKSPVSFRGDESFSSVSLAIVIFYVASPSVYAMDGLIVIALALILAASCSFS